MTLSSQPVSSLARRMFCPPRPMAWESFSSSTAMSHAVGFLVHDDAHHVGRRHGVDDELRRILVVEDDVHAFPGQFVGKRPERASRAWPTQAPTGSIRASLLRTAILARKPGSRAAPLMSIRPWPTSGTSSLKSSTRNSGEVRVMNSCGPPLLRSELRGAFP